MKRCNLEIRFWAGAELEGESGVSQLLSQNPGLCGVAAVAVDTAPHGHPSSAPPALHWGSAFVSQSQ